MPGEQAIFRRPCTHGFRSAARERLSSGLASLPAESTEIIAQSSGRHLLALLRFALLELFDASVDVGPHLP